MLRLSVNVILQLGLLLLLLAVISCTTIDAQPPTPTPSTPPPSPSQPPAFTPSNPPNVPNSVPPVQTNGSSASHSQTPPVFVLNSTATTNTTSAAGSADAGQGSSSFQPSTGSSNTTAVISNAAPMRIHPPLSTAFAQSSSSLMRSNFMNVTSMSSDSLLSYNDKMDCFAANMGEYSSIGGECNNLLGHFEFGTVGSAYLRLLRPHYAGDGSGNEMLLPPINPRLISNTLFEQNSIGDRLDARSLSNWVVNFGQFWNHDRHLDSNSAGLYHPIEEEDITLPSSETLFKANIPFQRAEYLPATGTDRINQRKIPNMGTTAWIDASPIYGATSTTTAQIRGDNGLLKSQQLPGGEYPKFDAFGFFVFGDNRANEQVGLTVAHLIWFREHQYQARLIHSQNPQLSSDDIFYQARQIVVAEVQKVSIDYFKALGVPIPEYSGYNGRDPSAYLEFVGSALRVGHSQIDDQLDRFDKNGQVCCGGPISLDDAFFTPERLYETNESVNAFIRGLSYTRAQAVDPFSVDSVRNLLFGPGSGLDLLAIDIQREFDLGIPNYNSVRKMLGLSEVHSMDEVTDDPIVLQRLEQLYASHNAIVTPVAVNTTVTGNNTFTALASSSVTTSYIRASSYDMSLMDLFVGGLSEKPARGASLGPTFLSLFSLTLEQMRTSDRFWFERPGVFDSTNAQNDARVRMQIMDTNFADIISRNSGVARSQLGNNVFFVNQGFTTPVMSGPPVPI